MPTLPWPPLHHLRYCSAMPTWLLPWRQAGGASPILRSGLISVWQSVRALLGRPLPPRGLRTTDQLRDSGGLATQRCLDLDHVECISRKRPPPSLVNVTGVSGTSIHQGYIPRRCWERDLTKQLFCLAQARLFKNSRLITASLRRRISHHCSPNKDGDNRLALQLLWPASLAGTARRYNYKRVRPQAARSARFRSLGKHTLHATTFTP